MSTRITDLIKAEIFGGSVGKKLVIKPSPGGGANHKKIDYDSVKRKIQSSKDLGKVTDAEMASRYGVSRGYAGRIRKDMGIEPFSEKTLTKDEQKPLEKRLLDSGLLGQYCDRDVARHIKSTEIMVKRIRQKNGIEVSNKRLPDWKRDILENKWPCLKEQKGLSKRQWKSYVQSL